MIGKEMKEPREMMWMMKDMIADSLGSFLFHLFSLGSWLVIPFVLHSPLASQTGGRSPTVASVASDGGSVWMTWADRRLERGSAFHYIFNNYLFIRIQVQITFDIKESITYYLFVLESSQRYYIIKDIST